MSRVVRTAIGAMVSVCSVALYGFAVEYVPSFGDPSDKPSIGGALTSAAFFGVLMLGFGLLRKVHRRRESQRAEIRTTSYERGIM